jgi:ATP-dependent DNA helicase RecG
MRPEILNPLFAELTTLKGVGGGLARPLSRLGLNRVVDALFHLPTGLISRTAVANADEAQVGAMIIITLTATDYRSSGSSRAPLRIYAVDVAGNSIILTFFGRTQGFAKAQLPLGEPRIISGKLEQYGDQLQIVHPDVIQEPGKGDAPALQEPVYPLSEGLSNRRLIQIIDQARARLPQMPEWIEPTLVAARQWPNMADAVRRAHSDPRDAAAHDRLAYDEIFAGQLAWLVVRGSIRQRKGTPLAGDGRLRTQLQLPFSLTSAQQRTISEIEGDMEQSAPMLRLLQGDVGSGKTVVALSMLLIAVEAGAQGALLAPTEILARQHYATLSTLLAGLPVNLAILTGRDKGRAREATLMGLGDGSIDILVGTHAVFQEAVTYHNLGAAVIDEQHKFGVAQRMLLSQKAARPPHMLVMTATPIPRTLTLTQFGDMDVSQLDEVPSGRTPVDTRVISVERIDAVIDAVGRHIESGAQAYWVCPLVEESDVLDLAAAEQRAALLRARFGDTVGLVHGRMKGPEKDAVMAQFATGALKLLVATTVIEVGVDVPNASLMIVDGAERFGLAQLHQLRGRVGRGTVQSSCLLLRSANPSATARERLALMRETNDGFVIAEADLKLRGEGEVLGTRQSGDASTRIASAEQVDALIHVARDDARLLMQRDGGLQGERGLNARTALYLFEKDAAVPLLRGG